MGTPTPKRGEAITIHFTGPDGKSYATVMQFHGWVAENGVVTVTGTHRATGELKGIDNRLDNQKRALDRMLEHLKTHCPEFQILGGTCPHYAKGEEAK